jgi:hypothetical protein
MTLKQAVMSAGQSAQQATAQQGFATLTFTATGTTQGTAAQLPTDFTIVTTAAASSGVLLPGAVDTAATPGIVNITDVVQVANHGANAVLVYPQLGGKISTLAANAGFSVAVGKLATFIYIGSGNWAASVSA